MNYVPIETCKSCRVCNSNCPAEAIDNGVVDKNNCIACFECVEACPFKAFGVEFHSPFKVSRKENEEETGRREFLKITVASACGIGITAAVPKYVINKEGFRKDKILPPGARNAEHYFSKCTGCNLCTSVCPNGVLSPLGIEDGFSTFCKPVMDFNKSFCEYDCNECAKVCPTGAIDYVNQEEKKLIRIGMVSLNESVCVSHKEGNDCGACAEQCPTGAVFMKKKGEIFAPYLKFPFCIGCGACENVCPTTPKAIIVKPLKKQMKARKPAVGEVKKKVNNDFPF